MRNVFAAALILGLAAASAPAQPFRIVTWQVGDIALPKSTNATPVAEPARIGEIANALSTTDADGVILYGISDGKAIKRIAESMQPKRYSVAIHSVFRQHDNRGPIVGQPYAILTKREKMASKNIDWGDTGRIDMPGGFAFATLRHGNGAVYIYVANLPGSPTNGISSADGAYFARKRNYAADFMAFHSTWVTTTYSNQPFGTYLTGDFNLAPRKPVKDECAAQLEKAGFRPVPVGVAQDKSAIAITNGPTLNRVFDPVFTRNVDFMATRQVPGPSPTDVPMVICEITLKPTGSASVTRPAPKPARIPAPTEEHPPVAPAPTPPRVQIAATPAPAPASQPSVAPVTVATPPPVKKQTAADPAPATAIVAAAATKSAPSTPSWAWPVAISGVCGLAVVIFVNARAARRRQPAVALSRPVFVELNTPSRSNRAVTESTSGAVLSEPTTATDNAHNSAWQTPSVRLNSPDPEPRPQDNPKAALVPHLRQLMREKLFQWLSNQRSQLLESHENGTAQVLGLEERLGKIRDQFQDKIIAQEQRIAEMNRELKEKEKQLNQSQKPESQGGQSKPPG